MSPSSSSEMEVSSQVPKLYNFLSTKDIENIQKYFKKRKSLKLSYEKFRSLLAQFNITYTDEAFRNVCLKIDLDRDNGVNWSEFIAYFIVELENDDNAKERLSIIPPIPKPANVLSSMLQSSAAKINFMGTTALDGKYITIGCYGEVNFWTSKWKLERTCHADEIPDTTSRAIELSDKRQIKKSPKTLILEACNLSDFQIICISSVCSDLRFYDYSTMGKCNLRLYLRNFPSPIVAVHFYCSNDSGKSSKLIFGDMVGSVRVIDFMKDFKFRHGSMLRQVSYQDLMKGKYETITCSEYINIHADVIRQVSFIGSLNSFISASESVITKSAYLPSVIIADLGIQETRIVFKMNNGTTCFAFDESSTTLATGGPDCILRLWNFIDPNRPKAILSGHTAGIVHIFMQDNAAKIYTMDKKKIIKVWDVVGQSLLQTFIGLKTIFPEGVHIKALYNDTHRELVVASKKILTLKCQPTVDLDKTDGYTHMTAVSLILFNELFDFLVTCSVSSTIIIWDVWKGRKVNLITQAHTRVVQGEIQLLGISAGCFDPKHQFLLTATDDGTLKVWNFNEGICLRTVKMESENFRISMVFWESQRIFAMGSKAISKFHDSKDSKMQITFGATWDECHRGDIVCASVREPDVIVTSCTGGDLIFWNFITGRPYLRFDIANPEKRLPIVYREKFAETKNKSSPEAKHSNFETSKSQRLSDLKSSEQRKIPPTAQCILSLSNRPMHVSTATFLVSLSSGQIQCWSHHRTTESYITIFDAIHVAGDVITAMTADSQHFYLFTGTAKGYIRTWMIVNFCSMTSVVEEISQVKLRETFPLFWGDDNEDQGQQSIRNHLKPQLLNSYQGHLESISGLLYFAKNQVLISSSFDKSVRLWSLSGQYIGTIGSPINWRSLSPNKPPPHNYAYRMPADLKNVVSETTLKVLEGGNVATDADHEEYSRKLRKSMMSEAAKPFERLIQRPIVKKDKQNETQRGFEKPTLDISLTHIPVYSHLRIHPTVAINLPQTIPKCLETNNLPNLQYIFLEPDELKTE